ncbi:MAG: hypothetical protein Q4E13_04320 [Clostridia bacterium]|nr:hypothetical protein [Clostridia bacterium]
MILFDERMRFWKGNTHMHTTVSDGKLSSQEAAALYREQGYDFIVQTDHWQVSPERRDGDLLVMRGVEFDLYPPRQTAHIVGVGVTPGVLERVHRGDDTQQTIDAINADGGCAILAHPTWSMNTPEFMASLRGLAAAEVFNTFSGAPWNADRADASALLDVTATWGQLLPQVAADDAHRYTGEACRSFTMVQADSCDSETIVAALKQGRFYASQGPRFLLVELLADRLRVRCSPVSRVIFYSNLPWVTGRCRSGVGIVEAEYVFQKERGETFVRCEIQDQYGAKAWLSPVAVM